ncbi:MAG TPA: cysteine--tRNA ligase [Caulobacteraceae bacterium]|jgi:cysteinyl-tRNA synthetase|nr:cysteine--tRNA ligase [Caulobacteraceae bacterium]
MKLALYDTMARRKREFEPRDPGRVTLYVCGPTVYDYAHIGNARPPVVFDVLFRLLRRLYGADQVIYARNVTDVDDKINAKAINEGVPIGEISARYETAYLEDMAELGVLPPTLAPHVTEHIEAIRRQIAALIERGAAYVAEGHVLFDVAAYRNYGELSGRNLEDMIAGARVEVAPYKKNPQDFVLWKPSKTGEPEWTAPWGPGRPGWHIECSAMIEEELGFPIDIHGGGQDLIFPHHENELAQGVCAHGDPVYARYWVHNGFLTMDAEKMSKSLGNVKLLHDLVQNVPGEAVRLALLQGHYRAPLDWTDALVLQSRKNLDRLYGALRRAKHIDAGASEPSQAFIEALYDDLNTPGALSVLFELSTLIEKAVAAKDHAGAAAAKGALLAAGELVGLLHADPDAWFEAGADEDQKAHIDKLIVARDAARKAKDWGEADRIRDELNALKVVVMDGPGGATWRFQEPV